MRPAIAFAVLALLSCRGPGTQTISCPDGYTQCGNDCFDLQNDPSHCGTCENACPTGQQCFQGACMPSCPTGEHPCNGVCVSSGDLATCGIRCTPCPMPAHGIATCDGTMCGVICDANTRFCGDVCASCPNGDSGKCMGNVCVKSGCGVGQHICNGHCVDENGGSCGDTCLACPMPPTNSYQVCLNGGCEYLCRAGYRWCAAGCCRTDVVETGGYHSCEVNSSGAILCWGRNHVDAGVGGQLGVGDYTDRSQPSAVLNATTMMAAVQPGAVHTCALDNVGAVSCWGVAGLGRIGDGSTSDKLAPMGVSGLGAGQAIAISAGGTGSCALNRGGQVRCWGDNTHGEVGDGTMTPRPSPTLVAALGTTAMDVSFGGSHACALVNGGLVRCWGDNSRGQLGDGTQVDKPMPVVVSGLSNVQRLSAGDSHTCALKTDGSVFCWGDNSAQQLGAPSTDAFRATPFQVPGVSGATMVSAGGAHTCALMMTGQILCWGANDSGQLGDGTTMGRGTTAPVTGVNDGTYVSAGRAHTCARTQSGTRCWGNNAFGQVGDGTTMNRPLPVMIQ